MNLPRRINAEATLKWQRDTVLHYRHEVGLHCVPSDPAMSYYILHDLAEMHDCYVDSYEDYGDPVTKQWRDVTRDALLMLVKGWCN